MKKWEKFSKEELEEIIKFSKTYTEALKKIGYSGSPAHNNIIREISQIYNIDISHFPTGKIIDLTGKKFGKLTVLKRVPNKNGNAARWLCQCDCGNQTEVDGVKLRRYDTLSCGCLVKKSLIKFNKSKFNDLKGERFGKLTVLERVENIGIQTAWLCQCDCGNQTIVMSSNLRKENGTRSCGCLLSKGEEKIINLLRQFNFIFKTQVKLENCISKKGYPLRFDFGIYDKNEKLICLIEYNGCQHYKKTEFWGFNDNFEERIERDLIKKNYCKKNNIPLIIIPYTHFKKLTIKDLMLETSDFIYKGE